MAGGGDNFTAAPTAVRRGLGASPVCILKWLWWNAAATIICAFRHIPIASNLPATNRAVAPRPLASIGAVIPVLLKTRLSRSGRVYFDPKTPALFRGRHFE